jgi:hypothetical protein
MQLFTQQGTHTASQTQLILLGNALGPSLSAGGGSGAFSFFGFCRGGGRVASG